MSLSLYLHPLSLCLLNIHRLHFSDLSHSRSFLSPPHSFSSACVSISSNLFFSLSLTQTSFYSTLALFQSAFLLLSLSQSLLTFYLPLTSPPELMSIWAGKFTEGAEDYCSCALATLHPLHVLTVLDELMPQSLQSLHLNLFHFSSAQRNTISQ